VIDTEARRRRPSSLSSSSDDNATDEAKTLSAAAVTVRATGRGDAWSSDEGRQGAVSLRTYGAYVAAAGGVVAVAAVLVASVVAEGARAFSFWWLAHWLEQGNGSICNVSSLACQGNGQVGQLQYQLWDS